MKKSWNGKPHNIQHMLTETSVRADGRRAVFVGAEAYRHAGGSILRELFQKAHDDWLEDPALLDRLVSEKLKFQAAGVRAEGWRWVEVALDLPYGYHCGLRCLASTRAPMSVDEEERHATLLAEYQSLETEHADCDECPEDVDARLANSKQRWKTSTLDQRSSQL